MRMANGTQRNNGQLNSCLNLMDNRKLTRGMLWPVLGSMVWVTKNGWACVYKKPPCFEVVLTFVLGSKADWLAVNAMAYRKGAYHGLLLLVQKFRVDWRMFSENAQGFQPWAKYLVGDFWLVIPDKKWKVNKNHMARMPCWSPKELSWLIGKQSHMGTHTGCMLGRSRDLKVPYIDHAHHHFQSFLCQ